MRRCLTAEELCEAGNQLLASDIERTTSRTFEGNEPFLRRPIRLPHQVLKMTIGDSRRIRQLRVPISSSQSSLEQLESIRIHLEPSNRLDDNPKQDFKFVVVSGDDDLQPLGIVAEREVESSERGSVRRLGESFLDQLSKQLRFDGVAC